MGVFDDWPAGPPRMTGTFTVPAFSSTIASRTNSFGAATVLSLSTMLTVANARAIVVFVGGVLIVTKNDSRLVFSGMLSSVISMRMVLVVSPGAKVSVPEVPSSSRRSRVALPFDGREVHGDDVLARSGEGDGDVDVADGLVDHQVGRHRDPRLRDGGAFAGADDDGAAAVGDGGAAGGALRVIVNRSDSSGVAVVVGDRDRDVLDAVFGGEGEGAGCGGVVGAGGRGAVARRVVDGDGGVRRLAGGSAEDDRHVHGAGLLVDDRVTYEKFRCRDGVVVVDDAHHRDRPRNGRVRRAC